MSTTNAAETETAPTTETEAAAPVIPGREEVLNDFAREILGTPEASAPPANAEAENAVEEALSQAEEDQPAEAVENHLEDDLRQELPEEVQDKINRRIGKEVAKTKAEREQREVMETRLAEAEAKLAERPSTAPRSAIPFGNVHDPAKLEVEKQKAEQALEESDDLLGQLADDPEGVERALRAAKVELKDETGEEDYSPARMREFLRRVKSNAAIAVRRSIPERVKFLQSADQAATQAVDLMPELKDPKSPQAKLFRQALADLPEIQNHPQWPLMAVLGVLGRQRLDELIAAKTKTTAPPAKREKPVVIPSPRAQPVAASRTKPQTVDAEALADGLLQGNKRSKLDYIKTLMPKA